MNKKITLIVIGVSFALALMVVVLLSPKKKKVSPPTITPSPTEALPESVTPFVETISPEAKDSINDIKQKLIGGHKFGDLTLEYREKNDLIIVFYQDSRSKAQEQTRQFFKDNGIDSLAGLNIEYIGLIKEEEEPPAGFFLD